MKVAPVRLITYLRTGSCPEGRVIEDRVLRPLSAAQRKQGAKDELKEWYRTYGSVRPIRRVPNRHYYETHLKAVKKPQNDPPQVVQEEVYEEMKAHLHFVAQDLAYSGVIGFADVSDVKHELFRAAIEALPDWDPEKASRKTFLYEATALNKIDVIRVYNTQKRQGDYRRIPIVNGSGDDIGDGCEVAAGGRCESVRSDELPDREARSIKALEFALALHDLAALLDPDELLALDYLLQDYEGAEVAVLMGMRYTTWRKRILESLRMKAECCGFEPHSQREVQK